MIETPIASPFQAKIAFFATLPHRLYFFLKHNIINCH